LTEAETAFCSSGHGFLIGGCPGSSIISDGTILKKHAYRQALFVVGFLITVFFFISQAFA